MPTFELLPFIVGIVSALGGVYLLSILIVIALYPILENAFDSDSSRKFAMVMFGSLVLNIALPFMVYGIAWWIHPEYVSQPWFIIGFVIAALSDLRAK